MRGNAVGELASPKPYLPQSLIPSPNSTSVTWHCVKWASTAIFDNDQENDYNKLYTVIKLTVDCGYRLTVMLGQFPFKADSEMASPCYLWKTD